MLEIQYRELAKKDLFSISDTIADDKQSVALEYINKLENSIDLLALNPSMGVECKKKRIDRKCRVLIFDNYLIFYETTSTEIIIIRVLNSKQNYQKVLKS